MAEIQRTTGMGEMTQRFIEFVMMQSQQISLFLGMMPHPATGKPEINLEVAKLFLDQLEMIAEKTRGNLSEEETRVLGSALSNLQLAYVEIMRNGGQPFEEGFEEDEESGISDLVIPPDEPMAGPPAAEMEEFKPTPAAAPAPESRKKFTKSYGS